MSDIKDDADEVKDEAEEDDDEIDGPVTTLLTSDVVADEAIAGTSSSSLSSLSANADVDAVAVEIMESLSSSQLKDMTPSILTECTRCDDVGGDILPFDELRRRDMATVILKGKDTVENDLCLPNEWIFADPRGLCEPVWNGCNDPTAINDVSDSEPALKRTRCNSGAQLIDGIMSDLGRGGMGRRVLDDIGKDNNNNKKTTMDNDGIHGGRDSEEGGMLPTTCPTEEEETIEDDNGLFFRPDCTSYCITKSHSPDEPCHQCHTNVVHAPLNIAGQYVLFPATTFHRGYYNNQEKTFFTAQFFAVFKSPKSVRPSSNNWKNNHFYQVQSISPKKLCALRQDLFVYWDDHYPSSKYPPSEKYKNSKVDIDSNRFVHKTQFTDDQQLHHVKALVDTFEEIYQELEIESVWFIKKTRDGDGFQRWHQDLVGNGTIAATIVLNIHSLVPQPQISTEETVNYSGMERKTTEIATKLMDSLTCQEPILSRNHIEVESGGSRKKNVCRYDDGEVEAWEHAHPSLARLNDGFELCHIEEAWAIKNDSSKYDYLHCRLYCDECQDICGVSNLIPIGNQAYINRLRNSTAWYCKLFVTGFLALVQHDAHKSTPPYKNEHHRIMLVCRTSYLLQYVPTKDDILNKGDATHFVSLAYKNKHFVVLYYDLVHRKVTVYDGLLMSITNWETQIIATIKLFGLELPDAKYICEIKEDGTTIGMRGRVRKHISMHLHFENRSSWIVMFDKRHKQSDGINCGPIACLKVLELYGFIEGGSINSIGESRGGYRDVVMDYYEDCCHRFHNELMIERRTIKNK